jgi:isopentenyl-diphosphate delta-isomerase
MTERVIFVDENNQPIGAGTRQEAWAKGIHLRLVRLIIKDENGRILVQHRAGTVKANPNCWTNSASGHVDEDETWDQAVRREMKEEIGISTELNFVGEFLFTDDIGDKKIRQFTRCYEGIIDSSTQFQLQESEVSEVKWYDIDELKNLMQQTPEMFTPAFRENINKFY